MGKHTAGPWEVNERAGNIGGIAIFTDQKVADFIADVNVHIGDGRRRQAEANARLIAAAPEMLEALQAILGFFDSGEFVRDTSHDFEQGWHLRMLPVVKSLADAKAAIAKATAA